MDIDLGYEERAEQTIEGEDAVDVELPRPPVCEKNAAILETYAPIY